MAGLTISCPWCHLVFGSGRGNTDFVDHVKTGHSVEEIAYQRGYKEGWDDAMTEIRQLREIAPGI